MMQRILAIKTIKDYSIDDFEQELHMFISEQEQKGFVCNIQFNPVVDLKGKIIYMALVEARG